MKDRTLHLYVLVISIFVLTTTGFQFQSIGHSNMAYGRSNNSMLGSVDTLEDDIALPDGWPVVSIPCPFGTYVIFTGNAATHQPGAGPGVRRYAIDMYCQNNANVAAVAAGTARVNTNRLGYWNVQVVSGSYCHWYLHMQSIAVQNGQNVAPGTFLGRHLTAMTAGVAPHLHFAITPFRNGGCGSSRDQDATEVPFLFLELGREVQRGDLNRRDYFVSRNGSANPNPPANIDLVRGGTFDNISMLDGLPPVFRSNNCSGGAADRTGIINA